MKTKGLLKTVLLSSESRYSLTESHFKDNSLAFVFKKFERVLHGIYLLTNHLDNKEPIKEKIRNVAVDTLLDISRSVSFEEEIKNQSIQNSLTGILSIHSMLETMVITGLIKETSYVLVVGELEGITKTVFDRIKSPENVLLIKDELFKVTPPGINQFKGQSIVKDTENKIEENLNTDSIISKEINHSLEGENIKNKRDFKFKDIEISQRRKTIMDFFKEKDKLTLKDISVLLPQYGEKTIQRELLFLTSVGALGRTGKKRWTLYFINK